MPSRLWSLQFDTSSETAEAFAEALGTAPLALTLLAPPRSHNARIEALYQDKPSRPDILSRLVITATLNHRRVPAFHIREVGDCDWLKKVAADFPPLPIARWIIHGAQHRKAVPDRGRALQIDATNAFGTGEHPTTRGCLLMLDWLLKHKVLKTNPLDPGRPHKNARPRKRRMLDMGCGSGILAMAWAKAHQGRAMAVDCDPDSVAIAKHNARANGLMGKIRILRGQGYKDPLICRNRPYDLVMANIFARPLATMAKDLRRHLRPGGMAILSGLLAPQARLVLAAHRMQKIYPVRIFRIGDWAVLVLKRKSLRAARRDNKNSNGRLG